MGCADRQARLPRVDPVEVRELAQCAEHRCRDVVRHRFGRLVRHELGTRKARIEEVGLTEQDRFDVARCIVDASFETVDARPEIDALGTRDRVPQALEFGNAIGGSVARQNAGVERADRYSGDPFGFHARLMQRVVGADVIRPERTPTLQEQDHLRRVAIAARLGRSAPPCAGLLHVARLVGTHGHPFQTAWRR